MRRGWPWAGWHARSALRGTGIAPSSGPLFRDRSLTTIVVEHREWFARFGAESVEAALAHASPQSLQAGRGSASPIQEGQGK
jgi:hypothetical protein